MNLSEINSIAFLHYEFPGGGAETVTFNLAKMLEPKGVKVYIFVYNLIEEKMPKDVSNIEIIKLSYTVDERNLPLFIETINEKNISLFVYPTGVYDVVLYSDEIRKNTNCKQVFMLHSLPFWGYFEQKENKKRSAKTSLLKRMEWLFLRSYKYAFGSRKRRFVKIYKECYDKVDIFGVLCEDYAKDIAKEIGVEYENSKFMVLNNHIEPNDEYVASKQNEICFIGRLSYWDKRPEHILRIWCQLENKYPDWNLNILGTGPEKDKLENLAKELNLKRAKFLGFVANPQPYYDKASIVCLTSNYEGWGMVLMEAQTNGCATIAFDCSAGVREILSPSWENGVLVKPFNENAFVESMSRLMSDKDLRDRIAENGRNSVKRFSPENTLKQWESMFENL